MDLEFYLLNSSSCEIPSCYLPVGMFLPSEYYLKAVIFVASFVAKVQTIVRAKVTDWNKKRR